MIPAALILLALFVTGGLVVADLDWEGMAVVLALGAMLTTATLVVTWKTT